MKPGSVSARLLTATLVAVTAAIVTGFGTLRESGDILLGDVGDAYALVIGGICKNSDLAATQRQSLDELCALLTANLKLMPGRLTVLVEPSGARKSAQDAPTAENIKAALKRIASSAKPGDLFVFWYKGQANTVQDTLRVNLEGPDMTDAELAAALASIQCNMQVIVLDCPGAGMAVKPLTRAGRVIMCGARSDQPYATSFTETFVPALSDPTADFDANGSVSMLEAFRQAVTAVDELYLQRNELKSETAILEDDGDGVPTQEPWIAGDDAHDGAFAARLYVTGLPQKGTALEGPK